MKLSKPENWKDDTNGYVGIAVCDLLSIYVSPANLLFRKEAIPMPVKSAPYTTKPDLLDCNDSFTVEVILKLSTIWGNPIASECPVLSKYSRIIGVGTFRNGSNYFWIGWEIRCHSKFAEFIVNGNASSAYIDSNAARWGWMHIAGVFNVNATKQVLNANLQILQETTHLLQICIYVTGMYERSERMNFSSCRRADGNTNLTICGREYV